MKSVSVEGHLWRDDTKKYDRSLILVKFGAFWGLIKLKLSGIRFGWIKPIAKKTTNILSVCDEKKNHNLQFFLKNKSNVTIQKTKWSP